MGYMAKDVMERHFLTVSPKMTMREAGEVFRQAEKATGRRVFGLMVADDDGKLVGMLSMYDIFLVLRPKHIHIWGEMNDLDISDVIESTCNRAGKILVGDIMTTDLITITPDTNLLHILDIMIKKHVRRIPVMEAGEVIGIVYISKVFNYFLDKLTGTETLKVNK
jgi:CBS domain-containing protein